MERGYLDGGDVLRIGRTLYVGRSSRTDAGWHFRARRAGCVRLSFEVIEAELRDCLHLKTGATFAGPMPQARRCCYSTSDCVDPAQFSGVEPLRVDPHEPAQRTASVPAPPDPSGGNPRTADRLRNAASPSSRSTCPSSRRPKPE